MKDAIFPLCLLFGLAGWLLIHSDWSPDLEVGTLRCVATTDPFETPNCGKVISASESHVQYKTTRGETLSTSRSNFKAIYKTYKRKDS